jgi:serine phosphatase RsbU (regulator of sigma subunit)
VAVGDVMGKGVRAASVMGQVRNALRGLIHADPEPGALLGWLDRVVEHLGDDEELVTLAYGLLDPVSGTFTWGCAGHPPPLLLSADDALYLDDGGSLPLGLGGERPTGRLALDHDEALLLFSDGLVESRARPLAEGLPLLQERARALLRRGGVPDANELCDLLVGGMLDVQRDDDVTVLLLRRDPQPQSGGELVRLGVRH